MAAPANPEFRLRNTERKLTDLLMGRRLAADPERTGVVDLGDFGKRCEEMATFAAQSVMELATQSSPEARCARRVLEEIELACRVATLLETLPPTPSRGTRQCDLLEEAQRGLQAAQKAAGRLEEQPLVGSYAGLARKEIEVFRGLVEVNARLETARLGTIHQGEARRALRRALLTNNPLELTVDGEGTLRFLNSEFTAELSREEIPRSSHEPPEVKRALDLCLATPDAALKEFLLAKAVEETLVALIGPRLGREEWIDYARALPRRPGKRMAIRPEAMALKIPGWNLDEAVKAMERLAERRAGPDYARLPKAVYLLRMLLLPDDALAGDLLRIAPALRRMERGEVVPGIGDLARRALPVLLGLLG